MALLGVAIIAGLGLAWGVAPGKSPLHCPEPKFDNGAVGRSQPIDHLFKLTNTSPKMLSGLIATTSCGCTSATLSQTSLVPGESVLVHVHMNMHSYPGPRQQRIAVTTTDPAAPPLVLTMQSTILDE
jgi:hypothetical protein